MPNCQNCDYKWSWFDTVKVGFMNNKKCLNCGERQYVSTKTKKRTYAIYLPFLLILLFFRPLFDLNSTVYVSFIILFLLVMIVTIPYTIKLSNKQEPLW